MPATYFRLIMVIHTIQNYMQYHKNISVYHYFIDRMLLNKNFSCLVFFSTNTEHLESAFFKV